MNQTCLGRIKRGLLKNEAVPYKVNAKWLTADMMRLDRGQGSQNARVKLITGEIEVNRCQNFQTKHF